VVRFSEMSRGQFAKWLLFGMVFLVGSITMVQQLGGVVSRISNSIVTNVKTYTNSGSSPVTNGDAGGSDQSSTNLAQAKFDYLIPGSSDAWKLMDGQSAYDSDKKLVKYGVLFAHAQVAAGITQQVFPDNLKPRDGDAFKAFIVKANPARSVDVNGGTLYFLPMLDNGAPSTSGTDTVIFARDDVLMFGQAKGMLGWDAWTQMMASMKKHS